MSTICPYCKKSDCVRSVVYHNVENYGSSVFHLPCEHCGEMIHVHGCRKVFVDVIGKSDHSRDESDF